MTKSFSKFRNKEEQHENVASSILSENAFSKVTSRYNNETYTVIENPDLREMKDFYKNNNNQINIAVLIHFSDVYVFSRELLHNEVIKQEGWSNDNCIKLNAVMHRATGLITDISWSGDYGIPKIKLSVQKVIDNKHLKKIRSDYSVNDLDYREHDLEEEYLTEATARKKIVIRGGKRKVLWKCPPGYKKKGAGSKQCVKRTGTELYKIKRRAKKAARKRRAKKALTARKRKRSNIKRKNIGLGSKKKTFKPPHHKR